MTGRVEFLLWAPDAETFASTMATLTLPDGQHFAWIATEEEPGPEHNSTIRTIDVVLCSEIGEVQKQDGTPVPGYHVNMVAAGWLADMLTEGLPQEGSFFERTRILELLGAMEWQPSAVGEPEGYVGTSGVKIYDPSSVDHRARVWA